MVYRMYYAPSDLKTALDVVSQFNVRVIAGGTDFFPSLKPGQIPTEILDVTGIAGPSQHYTKYGWNSDWVCRYMVSNH